MNNLMQRISNGEDSYTQFKSSITNADKLAQEFVAFSNARGGFLIVGVDDFSKIVGLNDKDIRKLNQLIGNVINTHIIPPIYPLIQIENIENKKILIIKIDEGSNKPYSTNNGIYLTKAGSDKRKISPQELRRLFAESKNLFPDENIVHKTTIDDIDISKLKKFLKNNNIEILNKLNKNDLDLTTILTNLELLRDNHLTLAGNLIFGETPQRFNPSFYVDCCYFDGNDVGVTKFISKKTIKGTFDELYEDSMRFLVSQLRSYQVQEDFNSNAQLEIHKEVLTELIVNALVHRDYYINSSIKIFMFHNRVEIISPGKLTNSLTVEKIKNGIAIQRNPILSSICKSILPYTGYGSGIKRVLELNSSVEFVNDVEMEQFRSIVYRQKLGENQEKLGENQEKLGENQEKLGENQEKLKIKSKLSKNKIKILNLIKENPKITISTLSGKIGISTTAIENNIKLLKENHMLRRIGSDKNGYWEIVDEV
ncbi:MAG: putative DNA binding domain-containing protein [Sulfurimonas sp.]|nr:putative DNA binding domain-containing protein [Sulfurimonas sp.]